MEGCCMIDFSKCKILVLTSLYPADDIQKSDTPVVHYFTKEWVKTGCDVRVIHYAYNLPSWALWIVTTFPKLVSKVWGGIIRTKEIEEREYILDDVPIKRITLRKIIPHGRYSCEQLSVALKKSLLYCEKSNFTPDVIISHWSNPQLEIMQMLKERFNVPTIYVAHNGGSELISAYSKDVYRLLESTNLIGFRSRTIEEEFRERFKYQGPSFRCNSGIPEQFVNLSVVERDFSNINSFIYVGTFIKRKYPERIIPAVYSVYGEEPYKITYVGKGIEESTIRREINKVRATDRIHLLGYLERSEVNRQLREHDVFIMISRGETFGLVYLEAMSTGCITIASRDEGMDGIIQHGVNGFLCEAGNKAELTGLIREIRKMPKEELQRISANAVVTARKLTDKNVAEDYLNSVKGVIRNA